MGKLEDCLATLAIIATSGTVDDAEQRAEAAVTDYLVHFPSEKTSELVALGALLNRLEALQLQSSAGALIWSVVNARICAIEDREPHLLRLTGARPGRASSRNSALGRG